jgi:hypothetical protein
MTRLSTGLPISSRAFAQRANCSIRQTLPDMKLEVRKYLFDIERAAAQLQSFIAGKTREQYLADAMVQAAVERQFEIIGEATAQLA